MDLECYPLLSVLFLELFCGRCCKFGMRLFSVLQNWNQFLLFYAVILEQSSFLSTVKTISRNFMAIKKQSGLALCSSDLKISNLLYNKKPVNTGDILPYKSASFGRCSRKILCRNFLLISRHFHLNGSLLPFLLLSRSLMLSIKTGSRSVVVL